MIQLTKQHAAGLGDYDIRVSCAPPCPVRTELAMAVHTPETIPAYHDALPLNRYELAALRCFLCPDKAAYITGRAVAVDGRSASTGVGVLALQS
ncbi:NAD(P)-dependent dehydrogenase (short-subunit alcohol dehydrogenase family) [Sagittula marina]|uniref:NAD(P)-dependent dehydrogenase (Short-subunit alcohol dehydrogenase family) n=1 Tax=Sagittula marina TaxID=943940 RepID=A0A7W6DPG2_9RHOB|nr:NAD(P)-dependent dehydrogenase (short-subunit alcohol dehydrogenase family) [Sagittula marina]